MATKKNTENKLQKKKEELEKRLDIVQQDIYEAESEYNELEEQLSHLQDLSEQFVLSNNTKIYFDGEFIRVDGPIRKEERSDAYDHLEKLSDILDITDLEFD